MKEYIELTKPRITWLILMSTGIGFFFGARPGWHFLTLVHTIIGTGLIASGTATLESLLCRCPMVVAYRFGRMTALLVRALRLVRLPYFALPNLLAGEALAPEFLQEAVRPAPMADALERLLADAPRREYLQSRFEAIHASLRQQGAALAAEAVIQCARERRARTGGGE